jgi:hypothetical protein
VQATRLLAPDLVGARELHAVARDGVGGEEAERIEVRAAQRVCLDDGVGAVASQAQGERVPTSGVVLAIDHRPLVQPEAAGVRGAVRRRGEQRAHVPRRVVAVRAERLDVEADGAVVVGRVPAPRRVLSWAVGRAAQRDARARVPASKEGRLGLVVVVEEVVDRMALASGLAGAVRGRQGVRPGSVRLGEGQPRGGRDDEVHPSRVGRRAGSPRDLTDRTMPARGLEHRRVGRLQ